MAKGINQHGAKFALSPSVMLAERLEVQRISPAELAQRCGRTRKFIGKILKGETPLDSKTAVQFEKVLGVSAGIWVRWEAEHQLFRARESAVESDAGESGWAENFPVGALVDRAFFDRPSSEGDRVYKLLAFFGVASLDAWNKRYKSVNFAYRNSPNIKGNDADLITWLRLGEIQAEHQFTGVYHPEKFMKSIQEIRSLTCLSIGDGLESATELCNRAGVSLAVVRPLPNAAPRGAACWMTEERPVILIGTNHKSSDELWFTFFHEAAHILLHGRKNVFLDLSHGGAGKKEDEADKWASSALIPNQDWADFITRANFDEETIKGFAATLGVAAGIIVGRLQYENRLSSKSMNHLKVSLPRQQMNSLDIEYTWVE